MSVEDEDEESRAVPEQGLPAGTLVLTPRGEVPVEQLAAGDLVIAVSGIGAPFQRILEIRRLSLSSALVRLRAGALTEGSPREDLCLPPGHGVLVHGTLVEAGALLGGPGAVLEQTAGTREVLGLVLAAHDAVLAAGTAVETCPPASDASTPFAPRARLDAALRALLSWRAEAMGWAEASPPEAEPSTPCMEDELASSVLGPTFPPQPIPGH